MIKVTQKRNTSLTSGGGIAKQEQDDDQRSTSSREDDTSFNPWAEPSPNLVPTSQNADKGASFSSNDRKVRSSVKKARLLSTTSTASTASNAPLKDVVCHNVFCCYFSRSLFNSDLTYDIDQI